MRKGTARRDVPTAPTPAPAAGGRAGSFFVELRRRNVFRMAGFYLVAGWLIVQVAETLLPVFGTPAWVLKAVIVLLALGFVPTLVFSWVYELTPGGLVREKSVARDASIVDRTARKLDIATMALLVVVATLVVWQRVSPAAPDRVEPAADGTTAIAATADPANAARATDVVGATPAVAVPPAASIAVLPFVNMSGDDADEYFSDGITEEILNALTRIDGLKVAGRTSSFRFKGRNEDLKAIGAALGVAHVLEGSVRRQGDVVRITAQLVKVEDGFHVWSQNYERTLVDIFAVQDEISAAIAGTLAGKLVVGAGAAAAADTIDPEAYDTYLRARQLLAMRDGERIRESIALFADVTARAPDFAPAWAGRGKAITLLYNYTGIGDDRELVDAGLASFDRALVLDPGNAEALQLRAFALATHRWQFEAALAGTQRAIAAAPNDAEVANFAGDVFRLAGDVAEAEVWERRALELDPLFMVNHSDLGWVLLMSGRPQEALEMGARSLRLDPGYWSAMDMRTRAYLALGDTAGAAAELERFAARLPGIFTIDELRARIAIAAGDAAAARTHVAALERRAAAGESVDYVLATLYARLGDFDAAAARLGQALADRDPLFVGEVEWVLTDDWPDDARIRRILADPALAPMFAARARTVAAARADAAAADRVAAPR